jgi:fucose permease
VIAPESSQAGGLPPWASAATPLVLFVTLGLPAGIVGVAWPHMRASLGAPLAGLGLLLAAFTVGYFVASVSTGPLAARLGTPMLLMAGCGLAGAGMLGLALVPRWWMVPVVSLVAGGGSGLIDAAVNAHVSLNRGIRYMGWLHASWALGAALGPLLVVLSIGVTGGWRAAFGATALAFVAIGLLVAARRGDWVPAPTAPIRPSPATTGVPSSYRRPLFLLIGMFLVGGGIETTAGDWSYTQLTAGRSVSAGLASSSASLFWAGLAAGRVGLGLLGNRAAPMHLLDGGVCAAALAALVFWLAPPLVAAFIALPILGMAVSMVFPLLLSTTPARVGTGMTAHAVGYELAAGTLGGGGLPAVTGIVLQSAGLLTLGPVLTGMAAALVLLHVISRRTRTRPGAS